MKLQLYVKGNAKLASLLYDRSIRRAKYHFGKPLAGDMHGIFASYVKSAIWQLELGRTNSAYFNLIKAMKKYPTTQKRCWLGDVVDVSQKVAGALAKKHHYDRALRLLDKALDFAKESACEGLQSQIGAIKKDAAVWNAQLASTLIEFGTLDLAEEKVKKALSYAPDMQGELHAMLADAYVARAKNYSPGSIYLSVSDMEDALRYAPERKEELYGWVADRYIARAKNYSPGSIDLAISDMKEALRYAPGRKEELYGWVAQQYVDSAKRMSNRLWLAIDEIKTAVHYDPRRKVELHTWVSQQYVKSTRNVSYAPDAKIELAAALKWAPTEIQKEAVRAVARQLSVTLPSPD